MVWLTAALGNPGIAGNPYAPKSSFGGSLGVPCPRVFPDLYPSYSPPFAGVEE